MHVTPITDLFGVDRRPIVGRKWQHAAGASGRVAVVLPGMNYPSDGPITYYARLSFLRHGWDWWSIDYRYNENQAYQALPVEAQEEYARTEYGLIGEYLRHALRAERLVLVGKSLGTVVLHHVLTKTDLRAAARELGYVILTPTSILGDLLSMAEKHRDPTLLVIGSADRFYEQTVVERAKSLPTVLSLVIPNAGHVLEDSAGDQQRSIANLGSAIAAIDSALDDSFFG
jgi:pimeloyl-ACP methyl ester carboxylesterase